MPGERELTACDRTLRRHRLGQFGRHQHRRTDTPVHRLREIHAEAVPPHVGADRGEPRLRQFAEIVQIDGLLPGDHGPGLFEPPVVHADAAVVHLDHRPPLHVAQGHQHVRGGRRGLRGVGQQFGDQVDQRFDHARRHGHARVAGQFHALVRGDATRRAADDVGDGEGVVPLLPGPFAAEGGHRLGVASLLRGGVVDPHAGLQHVGVVRMARDHPARLLLHPVGRGLHLPRERDHRRVHRAALRLIQLTHPDHHVHIAIELLLRGGIGRALRQLRQHVVVVDLFHQGEEAMVDIGMGVELRAQTRVVVKPGTHFACRDPHQQPDGREGDESGDQPEGSAADLEEQHDRGHDDVGDDRCATQPSECASGVWRGRRESHDHLDIDGRLRTRGAGVPDLGGHDSDEAVAHLHVGVARQAVGNTTGLHNCTAQRSRSR